MKRIATILLTIFFFTNTVKAQKKFDKLWIEVEEFEVNNLPKSALEVVEDIYKKAEKENNSPQIIKTLFYKSKFFLTLEEDAELKVVNNFKKHIAKNTSPTKNILQNILANLYWQYFKKNRYKFYNRTKTENKLNATDFRTWDLENLFTEIHTTFNASLQNETLLKSIKLQNFSEILQLQESSKTYSPTLFDFLANNALTFYKSSETSITKPSYQFIINDPVFLSDANTFSKLDITSKDSLSLQLNALTTYQKLINLHNKTGNTNALANIDIERLNFVNKHATFNDKKTLLVETLKSSRNTFKKHEASGLYAFEVAKISQKQQKNQIALAICNSTIKQFPKSLGANKCLVLKKQIKRKTLSIKAEKNIPIAKNSRLLITYKNIDSLYFTAYKISQKQREKFNKTYAIKEKKAFIASLEKVKSWQHKLRNEGDYLKHSTEIIVPKFENGIYLIVASENENLNKNTIYGTTSIQATNIALIENVFQGKHTYQVVNRNHGKPIKGAKIHIKNNGYHEDNYINKKLTTDSNGFTSFRNKNRYTGVNITIKTNNDTAIFGDYYLSNYKRRVDTDEDDITLKPFIFTDRSIYRPGQTVHFKAILLQKQGNNITIVKDKYVTVYAENVNGDEIKKFELQLNEFGSISSKFKLPDTGLTGEFTLYLDESEEHNTAFYDDVYFDTDGINFAVEEYKRPKFKSEFKPITKTFKINDTITVTGFSKAFSGANITDAKVIYNVVRKIKYPTWSYWRKGHLNTISQEITSGETTTNAKGEFKIDFKAIPDATANKKNLPIFTYEVTAEVTDLNGETRTAITNVQVGYHSLITAILMPQNIDTSQKEIAITIDSKNLNNQFVPAKGVLKIYKLQAPKNPLRKRPWTAPDYQDISENTFKILFPNDPYLKEETNAKNWKKGNLVFTSNFNTKNTQEIQLKNYANWVSGKYSVVIESTDKFGQPVKDEKLITLFSSEKEQVSDNKLFSLHTDKPYYKIGDKVSLTVASASKNITIIVQIEKDFKIVDTKLISLNNETKTIQIPVNKEDLGGFAVKYHFANYNYFESGNIIINVPEETENIAIETNIFRDRLQPGQDETWSFTIKNDKNNAVTAEVLASMYDASLDEFKKHDWRFEPISKKKYYSYNKSKANKSFGVAYFKVKNVRENYFNYPSIKNNKYNYYGFSFTNNRWVKRDYISAISRKIRARNQKYNYRTSGKFTGNITGFVKDLNGMPMIGVSVLIKGSSEGVSTDFDGKFSINVKKGNTLVFSYLGFNTQEIKVKNFSLLNIYLDEDYEHLEEIVVVGYGTQKKSSVVGSVSYVKTEDLQGMLPGVTAIQGSGTPGKNDMEIFIRGQASWNGNENSLIIVDGVITNINDVDFSDVENLTVLKGTEATKIYGAQGANGIVIITTKKGQEKIENDLLKVQVRKNFKETAFFFPKLRTDKNGKVSFNFTMPEALTKWKLQLLAHTSNLNFTTKTLQTITQKELMVVPNAPRFLREKDTITLSAKITNLTNNQLSGFAKLFLTDAITGKEINKDLQNMNTIKNFTVDKDGNKNVSWRLSIPKNIQAVAYKIVAKAGDFSDGEQNVLPVLTNRMLVTETLPMWVRSNQTKTFTLDKLQNNTSSTLQHHKLTLEVTSNPVWYAIQSLPYLMEYPYECAEQTFSRYYANSLASFIANSNPKIQEVFNTWKNSETLLSNLEKNQELKTLLIEETPWLRDAQSETEQKKRIALLFDLNKMKNEQEKAIYKLKDMQLSSGGFPWFKGGRYPSRFISQHIATGFGHLQKLGVSVSNKSNLKIIEKTVQYLDKEFINQYHKLLKRAEVLQEETNTKGQKENVYTNYLSKNNLNHFIIQYLYMRSFYKDIAQSKNLQKAIAYYTHQTLTYWNSFNLYAKGQIALTLFRADKKLDAKKILKSLKENSITSDELGMYWKSNTAGYYYYQAPVETQALLIEAFSEIDNDVSTINNLKIWLLKNKQTNSWKTTKATSEAIYALLLHGNNWVSLTEMATVKVGPKNINLSQNSDTKNEAGTGYFKTSWNTEEITPKMATVTLQKKDKGIAWGGLYWQYFENLDKITSAKNPLKLHKKLFKKVNSDNGKKLLEINSKTTLTVGDLITVRITLSTDRDMEFIHLKDMRASGVEPINVISKYKWQDNLGYYESTKDAATNFFFDRLPKGIYVFEYDMRVNNSGNFSNGISTIQSMYAPEFSSHSEGIRIKID